MQRFETQILPSPAAPLLEAEAGDWLTRTLPAFLDAAGLALTHEDSRVREAWQTLLQDVRELAAACHAAVAGEEVAVGVDDPPDAADLNAMLAQALRARSASCSVPVEGEAAFRVLEDTLAERLEHVATEHSAAA